VKHKLQMPSMTFKSEMVKGSATGAMSLRVTVSFPNAVSEPAIDQTFRLLHCLRHCELSAHWSADFSCAENRMDKRLRERI
jgi:23S rRNA maturation-related 3'-5' exoribonuclease YhaM